MVSTQLQEPFKSSESLTGKLNSFMCSLLTCWNLSVCVLSPFLTMNIFSFFYVMCKYVTYHCHTDTSSTLISFFVVLVSQLWMWLKSTTPFCRGLAGKLKTPPRIIRGTRTTLRSPETCRQYPARSPGLDRCFVESRNRWKNFSSGRSYWRPTRARK